MQKLKPPLTLMLQLKPPLPPKQQLKPPLPPMQQLKPPLPQKQQLKPPLPLLPPMQQLKPPLPLLPPMQQLKPPLPPLRPQLILRTQVVEECLPNQLILMLLSKTRSFILLLLELQPTPISNLPIHFPSPDLLPISLVHSMEDAL
jgi:hypothetical protein